MNSQIIYYIFIPKYFFLKGKELCDANVVSSTNSAIHILEIFIKSLKSISD